MSTEKSYLSAKVDSDSPLYTDFKDVVEKDGYESNSEAVRALIREGLEQRKGKKDTRCRQAQPKQEHSDPIRDNASAILMVGLILNAEGVASTIEILAAGFQQTAFIAVLFSICVWFIVDMIRNRRGAIAA